MSWSLRATHWLDASHGRVTRGNYAGNLLRAGQCNGPYIDMLMPGEGWQRLDNEDLPQHKDGDLVYLDELKVSVDEWLFKAVKLEQLPDRQKQ